MKGKPADKSSRVARKKANKTLRKASTKSQLTSAEQRDDAKEFKISLARSRYTPSVDGKWPTPLDELSERFGGRDATRISRNIKEAFTKGWVGVTEITKSQPIQRDDILEEELKHTFGLRNAVVVNTDAHFEKSDAREHSDATHKFLGRALSQVLALGESFRDKEAVGWGPGRGTHYVIDEFFRIQPRFHVKIGLYSMAGRVGAKTHVEGGGRFDSDINIEAVARHFSPNPDRHHLVHSIWSGKRRETTWLRGGKKKLDVGVVGVGVLAPGHAFVAEQDEGPPELRELVKICEQARRDLPDAAKVWVPCGDVCNRLIPIAPPPGVDFPQAGEVEDLVDKINEMTLTVGPAEIAGLPLTVVAGTLVKAAAIRSILALEAYNVQVLCTSRQVAQWLVDNHELIYGPAREIDDF